MFLRRQRAGPDDIIEIKKGESVSLHIGLNKQEKSGRDCTGYANVYRTSLTIQWYRWDAKTHVVHENMVVWHAPQNAYADETLYWARIFKRKQQILRAKFEFHGFPTLRHGSRTRLTSPPPPRWRSALWLVYLVARRRRRPTSELARAEW